MLDRKIVPILFDKILQDVNKNKEQEIDNSNDEKEAGHKSGRRRVAQLYKDVDQLEDDETIQLLMITLKRSPEKRSKYDIEVLMNITSRINFFVELAEKNGNEILRKCCKYMYYGAKAKGDFVFRQGDEGNTFYILLRGKAEVEVSHKVQKLSEDQKEIYFETTTDIVRTFKSGDSFGELALLENKPRSASIRCLEECHFAILEKSNFQDILKDIESRKLIRNLKSLGDMKIFSNWTNTKLKALMLRFIEKNYERNQHVYKEGDKSDGIYLIQKGEFVVSKNLRMEIDSSLKKSFDPSTFQTKLIKEQVVNRCLEIAFLIKGELFGEDDCYFNRRRVNDIKCHSITGVLFFLPKSEFIRQISDEEYSVKFLKEESKQKESRYNNRVNEMFENNIKSQKSLFKLLNHKRSQTYSETNKLFAEPHDISFISHKLSEISKNSSIFPPIANNNRSIELPDEPSMSFEPHLMSVSKVEPSNKAREEIKNKIRRIKNGSSENAQFNKVYSRKKTILRDQYEFFSPEFAELEEYEIDKNLIAQSAKKLNYGEKIKPLELKKIKEEVMCDKLHYLVGTSPFLSKYINYYPMKIRRDLINKLKKV